ncbi:MAG: tryptophan synthase subunit alpha [Actinomycetes bacterium]|jgi:tryptophan synthase alpha chain|nr:MAG: tryptophan synthase subunit alpha [Actinomycetota bacterium]
MIEPRQAIQQAIEGSEGPAVVAYLTAGHPDPDRFLADLDAVASAADVVEVGVPFSDPMADGVTIQRASHAAISKGVSLRWILARLRERATGPGAPVLLMSYLNPLLVHGYERLADEAALAGVAGFIVPDLPLEESEPLRSALERNGLALVQLVTPATRAERVRTLAAASSGFVYAVTRTGTTGSGALAADLAGYLGMVKAASDLPVCAGFGVRSREQVAEIGRHADGVIVGSALVEVLERGEDPAAFLSGLRP